MHGSCYSVIQCIGLMAYTVTHYIIVTTCAFLVQCFPDNLANVTYNI